MPGEENDEDDDSRRARIEESAGTEPCMEAIEGGVEEGSYGPWSSEVDNTRRLGSGAQGR